MAREMRAEDRAEMAAMSGKPDTEEERLEALLGLLGRSRGLAKAGFYDGQLVNVWGVISRTVLSTTGHPWMVTSDLATLRPVRRAMAHRCRAAFLDCIPSHVSELWNVVDVRNGAAIRWLKWLNFQFDPEPIEHGGAVWLKFGMTADVH